MITQHHPIRFGHHSTRNFPLLLILSVVFTPPILCVFSGCTSPDSSRQSNRPHADIAAVVNGQPITSGNLWPHLAEASGEHVLEEVILTRLLDSRSNDEGWHIDQADLDHELDALVTTISQTNDPATTPRLIESIRRKRGLGPARFNGLLRRNAILRRLIASDPALAGVIQTQTNLATNQLSTPPSDDQLIQIIRRATLVSEQQAMESLARSMLSQAEILVMDRSLHWSRE